MSWGYRILALYLGFVAFILSLVTLCIMQKDIFLVDKEYYKEEIAYQTKLDKLNSSAALPAPVTCTVKEGKLLIVFPEGTTPAKGDVHLFRPSNANLDRHLPVKAGDITQLVDIAGMAPGLWRIKLDWESKGTPYFFEEAINIPKNQ